MNTDNRIAEISNKLRLLRKANGWSSYETFAFDNNLDRKQYWRIESGANFTIATFFKVLDIHKLTIKEFFNIEIDELKNK